MLQAKNFFIKQNGDFFELDEEREFYLERLKQLCEQPKRRLQGYFLHPKEVIILAEFADAADVGALMRALNSSFARFRKNLREAKKLKKYSAKELDMAEFAAICALITHLGGTLLCHKAQTAASAKKLSFFEKVNAQKFPQKPLKKEKKMNLVALNASAHKNLCFHEELSFDAPAAAVMVSEALQAEHFYAMVFTNSETPELVALLGQQRNLLLNERTYLPASVANYPFFWLPSGEERESLCIDLDAPQFKGAGARLFNDDGSESEFLAQALEKLKRYRHNQAINEQFIKEILAANVLQTKELAVTVDGAKRVLIKGFSVIDRRKLDALPDSTLADWARRGHLEFIHAHLRSLRHLNALAARIIEDEN